MLVFMFIFVTAASIASIGGMCDDDRQRIQLVDDNNMGDGKSSIHLRAARDDNHRGNVDLAHKRLDEAVFAAYGWKSNLSDEEILEKGVCLANL